MKDCSALFKSKKITVLGLGLLGRGVGDVEFLAKCGARVLVTDKKTVEQLAESVEKLKQYKNVSFKLGGHNKADFIECDMVLKAAGVPLNSSEIAAARVAGIPVAMSTALFAKYAMEAGVKIVGVTGTRGKSTVTHLIHHALQKAGKPVHLGGNVRGISTLALLQDIKRGDVAILELDSWQLQGFGDLKISPHIAVFTNLMPDHLNYYPDMKIYFADKANIFKYQKSGDALFVGKDVLEKVKAARPVAAPLVPPAIPADWKLKIPGEHNRENASFAVSALRTLGISDPEIYNGLESFEGVEGRLQFVREVRGVKIFNDNNATTPEATDAALKALAQYYGFTKPVILIMGGSDKELNMSGLISNIKTSCKAVFLLAGTGTDRIRANLENARGGKIMIYQNLPDAVSAALDAAKPGDTILFSPAFASFGVFKNEYDRNDQFLEIVNSL